MSLKDHRMSKPKAVPPADRVTAACAPWMLLLPDAAEGLLSDAEQRALDQHLAQCASCSEELAAAHRGLIWLTVLKEQTPEPPAHLLSSILAHTTGMAETGAFLPERSPQLLSQPFEDKGADFPVVAAEQQGTQIWRWLRGEEGTWSSLLQPRLAMTGAMAFLSICLTINLLGAPGSLMDAQSFRRGGLHRTVADTGATLLRSIQGLRVVYRVQSRVSEMRAQMDGPEMGDNSR